MAGCRNGVLAEILMGFALATTFSGAPARGEMLADAGATVYALRCSVCHGVDLNNTTTVDR